LGLTLDQFRLWARWVVPCVILAAAATYLISWQQTRKYSAAASLLFKSEQPGGDIATSESTAANRRRAQWPTEIGALVRSGDPAAKTAAQLRGLAPAQVSGAVRVSSPRKADRALVTTTWTSPELAASIATTYARMLVAGVLHPDHVRSVAAIRRDEKLLAALPRKERRGAHGDALQRHIGTLRLFDKLDRESVKVDPAREPHAPSSPRIVRNTVFGAVGGLLLGLLGVLMIERFRRRSGAPEDLASLYGLPLLGAIPRSGTLARLSRPTGSSAPEPLPQREDQAFQLIRARLRYFKIDRELRTLLVISPSRGDGRTTIARHLASAAARSGSVVLLIEADLRTPVLAWQLGLQPGPGLADVVIGEVSLWSATQLLDVDAVPVDGPNVRSLDVLPAGVPLPPNPGKLIKSEAMSALLEEARSTYDMVVIDTPPLKAAADAFPLLSKVDGVIVVARGWRRLTRASAVRLRAGLDAAGAPLLGVIANCVYDRAPSMSPEASHQHEHAAAPADPRSWGYTPITGNGLPPTGTRATRSRSSSRSTRGAAGERPQAEGNPQAKAWQ
jgi:capsular exopolysaccharide synthesis family protein